MRTYRVVTMLLAIALWAVPAFAGAEAAPPADSAAPAAAGPARHDGPGGILDEDLRDLVSTIFMVRVSRNLELSDEQTVVMVRHMQEMRDEMSGLYNQREDVVRSLRGLVEKDGVSDADIDAKLNELMTIDQKRIEAKKSAFDKISEGLTAKQKAKLYVTLQDFENQMRKMMARAKEMGEDVVLDRMQKWERGEGPGGPPMDRPMVRQMMKNRRGAAPAPEDEPKAKTPEQEGPREQ
ncbi:MAG: hypothetical protein FJY92_01290 [Candidatus Hydrogenedentes bacterium]|nr:hypothetical protein [Candidatus Hydrogenedentota bacterium]